MNTQGQELLVWLRSYVVLDSRGNKRDSLTQRIDPPLTPLGLRLMISMNEIPSPRLPHSDFLSSQFRPYNRILMLTDLEETTLTSELLRLLNAGFQFTREHIKEMCHTFTSSLNPPRPYYFNPSTKMVDEQWYGEFATRNPFLTTHQNIRTYFGALGNCNRHNRTLNITPPSPLLTYPKNFLLPRRPIRRGILSYTYQRYTTRRSPLYLPRWKPRHTAYLATFLNHQANISGQLDRDHIAHHLGQEARIPYVHTPSPTSENPLHISPPISDSTGPPHQ